MRKRIPYKGGDGAGKLQIELFEKTGEHTLVQPTFAYAYPAEVSPLSRRNDRDPFITDRWEFFIGGRELANGFSELNDSEDQAQRFRDQVERKAGGDEEAMYLRRRLCARARVRHASDRRVGARRRPRRDAVRERAVDPRRALVPAHAAGAVEGPRGPSRAMALPAAIRRDAPIGVFDSGVGGLTVLRALSQALPSQNFIYLGDTARLPYGTKSPDTVSRYSLQCAQALLRRGIGALVVACNTASASALGALSARYPDLPIIGVIEPGAQAAIEASQSQHIAVIATEGTINGGAYQTEIRRRNPAVRVLARACSMFVALAEEGWTSGPVAEAVAHRYLDPVFAADDAPDTLVLGMHPLPHSYRGHPRGDTARCADRGFGGDDRADPGGANGAGAGASGCAGRSGPDHLARDGRRGALCARRRQILRTSIERRGGRGHRPVKTAGAQCMYGRLSTSCASGLRPCAFNASASTRPACA